MQKDFDGGSMGALGFEGERTTVRSMEDRVTRTERLAVGSRTDLSLVFFDGTTVGLAERELTIGRAVSCDVTLLDRSVSALHARVIATEHGYEIHDLASTNGTWIDGVRVSSARLRPGIELALGRSVVRCVQRSRSDRRGAESDERGTPVDAPLLGASDAMRRVRREVAHAAATPYAVLVCGESGSGKELVAQAIHRSGSLRSAPFIAINAGAIPETLVESELFGHERGAFTGANARRRGAFEQAHNGVLFLDEVGELPLAQQAKLLRVLETGELRRLGSEAAVQVNVKLVCATHRDLQAMAAEGRFREDLLWRIEQHTVRVPALRERLEDLPSLARRLCERVAAELGRPLLIEDRAIARLLAYEWPGNVRELLAVLRSAAARAPDVRIGAEHLGDFECRGRSLGRKSEPPPQAIEPPTVERASVAPPPKSPMPEGEALLALLGTLGGSLSALARATGRSRAALRERVRKAQSERARSQSRRGDSTGDRLVASASPFDDSTSE